ncbi:MAG: DUF6505 family protein [Beijerinckiaceae bacterium]
MIKLLRTLRLDASDTFVFARAAEAGEWAVPGSFRWFGADVGALSPKERVSFRSSFLGLSSFGDATLAVVVEATAEERMNAVQALAVHLVEVHGAPDMGEALAAADEEVCFAESCADHPEQTIVVLHRTLGEGGDIREQIRTVKPGLPFNKDNYSRVFTFHEVEGEDEIEERVDLAGLAEAHKRP